MCTCTWSLFCMIISFPRERQNASAVAAGITSFLNGNGYDAITSAGGLTGTFATAQ